MDIWRILSIRDFAVSSKRALLKEKLELYVRPGNSEKWKVPLVNHELWGKLKPPPVKSQDLRLANVQQNVVKATIALAEATEKISKVKRTMDEKTKIISSLTNLLPLLGHATYDPDFITATGYYEDLNKHGASCPLQSASPSNGFPLRR